MSPVYLACMALVSGYYHLPPRVLPSIQAVEGGRPGLVSPNRNGTADYGVMQINSIWVPPLAKQTGLSESMVRVRLIHDPCFNIATAGAILRIYLDEERGNVMRAIGNYHSHTPFRNEMYQLKVLAAARRLAGMPVNPSGRSAAARRTARSVAPPQPATPAPVDPPPPVPEW